LRHEIRRHPDFNELDHLLLDARGREKVAADFIQCQRVLRSRVEGGME